MSEKRNDEIYTKMSPETLEQLKKVSEKLQDVSLSISEKIKAVNEILSTGDISKEFNAFNSMMDRLKKDHPKAMELLEDDDKKNAFIDTLSAKDIRNCFQEQFKNDNELDYLEKIEKIYKDGTTEEKRACFEFFSPGMVIDLYEYKHPERPTKYRTKANAGEVLDIVLKSLPTPTLSGYKNALSFYEDGNAYLQLLTSTENLRFQNGHLFFNGPPIKEVTEAELQNINTKEGIEEIDLPKLKVFYGIILKNFENNDYKKLNEVITMRLPDFAECMGKKRNLDRDRINELVDDAQQFHNIIGLVKVDLNGKTDYNRFPVLNFEGYNAEKNTISFSSPYMNYVIEQIYNLSIRKDKNNKPKLKKSGKPQTEAAYSYLVKPAINKERNKAAIDNVFIICTVIDTAGENVPRIKASTIIERNPGLKQRLENSAKPSQLLKRVFSKTWELLSNDNYTYLHERYKSIQLPDPKDPANIPTLSNYKSLVFSFPHDGKIVEN